LGEGNAEALQLPKLVFTLSGGLNEPKKLRLGGGQALLLLTVRGVMTVDCGEKKAEC